MVLNKNDYYIEKLIHDILFSSMRFGIGAPFSKIPLKYRPQLKQDIELKNYKDYIITLISKFYGIDLNNEDIDDDLINIFIKGNFAQFDLDSIKSKDDYNEILTSFKKYLKLKISHQILSMSIKGYFPYIKEPSLDMCLDYLQNPNSNHKDVLVVDSKTKEECLKKIENKIKLESLIK